MSPLDTQTRIALRLRSESIKRWGKNGQVSLLGTHPRFRDALERTARFAGVDRTVLLTGESGVGKEAFARSLYLLSDRVGGPFLSVNCAQFRSEDLMVSELFGHAAGSFTGATSDHAGIFARADGGVVFLDEVAELTPDAQAMLLRTLDRGEILPLGGAAPQYVDVRIVAATNQPLGHMVEQRRFRNDLYYRLNPLQLTVPPLRERGEDWRIITEDRLDALNHRNDTDKTLSGDAVRRLARYPWPGNVRELLGVVDYGYCLSLNGSIDSDHLAERLSTAPRAIGKRPSTEAGSAEVLFRRLERGETCFWNAVRTPYLDRELNRAQVRRLVEEGLRVAGGYKPLLPLFGIDPDDYQKFMDFLRHHRLKPEVF